MTAGDGDDLFHRARDAFADLQDRICRRVESLDGAARFRQDDWSYRPGRSAGESGGGRTRVLEDGAVFEKAGVNVSAVAGGLSGRAAERLGVEPSAFRATGVSLVLHPRSPHVPTVHMNLRYFELRPPETRERARPDRAWFGGGADLTPYFLVPEDVRHFHVTLKSACDRHDRSWYPRFKRECDRYFRNAHRDEARGVGGVFFDRLSDEPEATFRFVRDVGEAFLPAYVPVVERNVERTWTEAEREWQLLRRGRYVEFNLIHDRGTSFGLETGGRTESILMSLPPIVRWRYDAGPTCGPDAAALLDVLREPREWV